MGQARAGPPFPSDSSFSMTCSPTVCYQQPQKGTHCSCRSPHIPRAPLTANRSPPTKVPACWNHEDHDSPGFSESSGQKWAKGSLPVIVTFPHLIGGPWTQASSDILMTKVRMKEVDIFKRLLTTNAPVEISSEHLSSIHPFTEGVSLDLYHARCFR